MQGYESIPPQPVLASVQGVEELKHWCEVAIIGTCGTKIVERDEFPVFPARVTIVAQIVRKEVISLMRCIIRHAMKQLDASHDPMDCSHIVQKLEVSFLSNPTIEVYRFAFDLPNEREDA
jgi:hypothetical protein